VVLGWFTDEVEVVIALKLRRQACDVVNEFVDARSVLLGILALSDFGTVRECSDFIVPV